MAPPASGKSTLAARFEREHNYERINQDTLKTEQKCFLKAREAIVENNKSVVVDNTNINSEIRKRWISFARELNIPVSFLFAFHIDAH